MVVDEELVSKVKSLFNLNTYEAKVWLALLSKGVATASEISTLADIPRSRAYDVLESLEKKGFVVMKLGKPIKYIAISPTEVVDRLRKRYEEMINNKVKVLEDLKNSDIVKELENIHKSGEARIDITEKSAAIKGQQNIISHLETMLKEAEERVNIVTTEISFVKQATVLKPVFYELKERNVMVRILTPIKEENARFVKDLLNYAEIYDSGDLRGRVVTIDSEEVLMMIFDEKDIHSAMDIGIWLYAPALAKFIDNMIDNILPKLKPAQQVLAELNL